MAEQIDVSARLDSAADRAEQAADILHAVANGGPAAEVSTNNGPVPSVAKWLADHEAAFTAQAEAVLGPVTEQAGIAEAAAATAASEADRAEVARDAAMASGAVYADTAAGLAATTSGQYFSVPSTESAEHLVLYKNNAGEALEVKRYPSASAVEALSVLPVRVSDIELAYTEQTLSEIAARARTGVFPSSSDFFGFGFQLVGLTTDANFVDVSCESVNANATIRLRIISRTLANASANNIPGTLPTDSVLQTHEFLASTFQATAELQTVTLPFDEVAVDAGHIYIAEVQGLLADDSPGSLGFGRAADAAASVPEAGWFFKTATPAGAPATQTARYSYMLGRARKALPDYALASSVESLPKIQALCVTAEVDVFARWPYANMFLGSSLFSEWAVGIVPETGVVDGVEVTSDQVNFNDHISLDLWFRAVSSSYTGAPSLADGDVLVASYSYPGADFINTDGVQNLTISFPTVTVPADTYLIVNLRAVAAGGGRGKMGLGRIDGVSGLTQVQRGYYKTTGGWLSISEGSTYPSLAIRAFRHDLRLDGSKVVGGAPVQSAQAAVEKFPGGLATKIFGGRMEYPFNNSTPKTFRTIFSLAQDFDWVRVIFGHGNAAAASINKFAVAPLATADYAAAGAAWTAGTFSGVASGSIPARKSSRRPGLLVSDWIKVSSLPRTDDANALPLLAVSAYMDTAETVTMLGSSTGGDDFTNWAAHPTRPHVMRYNDGDCVAAPASFVDTTNRSTSPIIGIQYRARGQVVTVFAVGDSITDGRGTYLMGNWAFRACAELSSMAGIAYEYGNLGWSGCSTAQMLGRFEDYLSAGIVPDVGFVAAMSPNDISGTITDAAVLAGRQNTAAIVDLLEQAGCRPVLWTWLPTNSGVKAYGSSDSKRIAYNNEIRAQASRGRVVADFDSVLDGVTDGSGQVQMLAGSTADGIHPNDAGEELIKPLAKSAIQAAAVIKPGSLIVA